MQLPKRSYVRVKVQERASLHLHLRILSSIHQGGQLLLDGRGRRCRLRADAAEFSTTSLIFFPAAAWARIISARLHDPELSIHDPKLSACLEQAEKAGIAARLTALLRIYSRSERPLSAAAEEPRI